jgi:hypothetical protein
LTRSAAAAILARYDRDIAAGDVAGALVTGMQGAQMGPAIFNALPHSLLAALTNMMMANEDKKAKSGEITFRMLAPTLHYDFQLVVENSENLEVFKGIPADVLLLGGSQSPAYLKAAVDSLAHLLPHAKRVEIRGVGHGGSGPTKLGGRPDLVAQELRAFFA